MSVFTYIASNYPLEEVKNMHLRLLSVNEAIEIGIEVPEPLLEPSFDRDKPDVMLLVDKKENLDEISIHTFNPNNMYDDIYNEKKYCASLQWEYTKARAEKLISYIHNHLMKADEIEICQIWLGKWFDEKIPEMKTYHVHINQLSYKDLERIFKNKRFKFSERIIVSRMSK